MTLYPRYVITYLEYNEQNCHTIKPSNMVVAHHIGQYIALRFNRVCFLTKFYCTYIPSVNDMSLPKPVLLYSSHLYAADLLTVR